MVEIDPGAVHSAARELTDTSEVLRALVPSVLAMLEPVKTSMPGGEAAAAVPGAAQAWSDLASSLARHAEVMAILYAFEAGGWERADDAVSTALGGRGAAL